MAYTNETTHFGFPLPLGSDLTVPMDYNESLEDADNALYEAQTNAAGAVGTAGNALTVANEAKTEAQGATATANSATATAGAAATAANEAVAAVAEAKDDALDMICAVVEETATAQYKHEPTKGGLNYYFRYNDILYKTTAVINVGETIVPNTNCSATNVATELAGAGEEIGNLNNLQTTTKTNLVAAINEVLSQIGGGAMPLLDFANPVHSFSSTTTYTTTKDLYLCGSIANASSGSPFVVNVDGTPVASCLASESVYIAPLLIKRGSTVSLDNGTSGRLHLLDVAS